VEYVELDVLVVEAVELVEDDEDVVVVVVVAEKGLPSNRTPPVKT